MKPGKFSGTNWNSYKIHFTACRKTNGWDDITAANALESCLIDDAIYVVAQKPLLGWSFQEFIAAMDVRYNTGGPTYVIKQKLKGLQQRKEQSIQQFADECTKMVYLQLEDREIERALVLNQFQTGLRNRKTMRHLNTEQPTTIMEALRVAKEFEEGENWVDGGLPNPRVNMVASTDGTAAPDVKSLQAEIDRLKQQNHQQQQPATHRTNWAPPRASQRPQRPRYYQPEPYAGQYQEPNSGYTQAPCRPPPQPPSYEQFHHEPYADQYQAAPAGHYERPTQAYRGPQQPSHQQHYFPEPYAGPPMGYPGPSQDHRGAPPRPRGGFRNNYGPRQLHNQPRGSSRPYRPRVPNNQNRA